MADQEEVHHKHEHSRESGCDGGEEPESPNGDGKSYEAAQESRSGGDGEGEQKGNREHQHREPGHWGHENLRCCGTEGRESTRARILVSRPGNR